MVFRKGTPFERWRSLCLERIRIEARMARFNRAAARRTKKRDGNRRSQRHSVHSRPHRFRRRPIPTGEQDSVSSSNLVSLRCVSVVIGLCTLTACQYDIPITSAPTRKVQEQLLGDWTSADGNEKLKLRSLDDSTYIVYYDGDLFRAYHSDVAETPCATVQDLNSSDRKYSYVIWKLSDDGKKPEIAERQRQGRSKGNQGLSH